MLAGLTLIIVMQLLGTFIHKLCLPVIPGQVIGMLLLFAWLVYQKKVSPSVQVCAARLRELIPLFLVPTAVSVVLFAQVMTGQWWIVVAVLLGSLVISLPVTAWLMQWCMRRRQSGSTYE